MTRTIHYFFYCFCCLFFQVSAQGQEHCLLTPVSLDQRVQQSSLIAEGRVVDQHSFWDAPHQRIYTSNMVQVYKVFKGSVQGERIEIITEGGTVGNTKQVLTSTLTLGLGQSGIFFCSPHKVEGSPATAIIPSYMVYSSMQGFIQYNLNAGVASSPFQKYERISDARKAITQVTKADFRVISPVDKGLEQAESGRVKAKTTLTPIITSFAPTVTPGGIGALLTITGSNFGAVQGAGYVEFPNANDGGISYVRPVASDYVTWTNNQIVVKVPSTVVNPTGCAGTGNFRVTNSDPNTGISPTPLTITYTWTNINDNGVPARADLVNDNGTGGYTFQYYTAFATNTAATAAFQRAMSSWCPTQVNWLVGSTSAVNVVALDNVNIVRFDVGAELPAGVLGRLSSYYSGCGPVGGPFTWYVTEMDVVFDDAANWQYGPALPTISQADFESVALHELGHGIQLNHVINTADVMHYALTTGQTRRVLNVDDLTGGNNVTATSILPNACGSSPMLLLPYPLPLQLTSFTGKIVVDGGASLEWKVAEEEDIDGYRVEKSIDGVRFSPLTYVKSNNNNIGSYSHLDEGFADEAYYRLIITEVNGSIRSSNIVHLRLKGKIEGIRIYPNPASNSITLSSDNVDLTGALLVITSLDGKVVKQQTLNVVQGAREETISLNAVAPGLYFYKLNSKSGSFAGRIIKQ